MNICILDMPSYTYAVKAQRLLRARGYPSRIKRRERTPERGCGFSLRINGACDNALRVLDSYDIPYSIGGGDDNDKL